MSAQQKKCVKFCSSVFFYCLRILCDIPDVASKRSVS